MLLSLRQTIADRTKAAIPVPRPKSSAAFSLPVAGKTAVWEAERASRVGAWQVKGTSRARAGAFVRPAGEKPGKLTFHFDCSEPANIQVWPLLGPHSDQRPPRRFPYPLERRPGPDTIDWWQKGTSRLLFFASPELGRVAALDERTEKVIATATPGGYLTDLVVDRDQQRVFVADATGNRVLALSCADLSTLQTMRVPHTPVSLSLYGGTLFVGCRHGRSGEDTGTVVALDARTGGPISQAPVPFELASVEISSTPSTCVVARPFPVVFDLETQKEVNTDTERYSFRRRTFAETGVPKKPGWKRYETGGAHVLRLSVLTEKGLVNSILDTRGVTEPSVASTQARLTDPLKEHPGPGAMVIVSGRLYFTAPLTGRVGVVDLATDQLLPPIDIGGSPSDIAADTAAGLVFVADATGNQVVILKTSLTSVGTVQARVTVPENPVALELFLPPGWLKGCKPALYVACRRAKQIVALDPTTAAITWKGDVSAEPMALSFLMPPNSGWWPLIPTDRLVLEMRTRLGVLLTPESFDPVTLRTLGPAEGLSGAKRRTEVSFDVPGGRKVFGVDNQHTIKVALLQDTTGAVLEQRWIDTTNITDPQVAEDTPPIGVNDEPGAVVLALDGGTEFPWRRGIWMTPDQEQFQKMGTGEFWEWNATHFALSPGRHILTLKATSPFTQIDALCVRKTLKGWADLRVVGCPPKADSLPEKYRSLFYDKEPVRFDVSVANNLPRSQTVALEYQVTNYLDQRVAQGRRSFTVEETGERSEQIHLPLQQTGSFTLSVSLRSTQGERKVECRFLRIPKLEHPRMLFRREQIPGIKEQIAKHGALFGNYFEWLRRQCEKDGFLPASLTVGTFTPKLPEAQKKLPNGGGWRRYELGWRMLAVQFAAMFDEDSQRRDYFRGRIADLLKEARADYYVTFHHHGPFFPGMEAALFDLVAATPGEADESVRKMRDFFHGYLGDMNVLPWTLACLEEPLTPRDREVLWHIGEWLFNVERYFNTHMGKRGGQRWLNDRTGCFCPYAGYGYSFIYLRNLLNEPHFQERKLVTGFLTHTELIHPMRDNAQMLGPVGPRGEPLKWIDSLLSHHPLLKNKYSWELLVRKLDQPQLTAEAADRLLEYPECASTSQPMAFVVPLGLALGWYQPAAREMRLQDLPPTLFFDGEGEAIMRSGWQPEATEVYFTAGIRDHVYRHQPTHLQIAKSGEFLLGTASSWGDDGNSDPGKTWGNVVVIEPSDWLRQWGENKRHPRAEEYPVFNRFSDETFRYLVRDQRLTGYAPAESGFGGGMDMHGHTESVFVREGETLAYETWPDFDYVAGDATNAWPLGLAEEVYRQVVFVKPDTVVVYDRVTLGPKAERAFWLAATGPQLEAQGRRFSVRSGSSAMSGEVLLPVSARLESFDPAQPNKYSTPPPFSVTNPWYLFDGLTKKQKVLEILPGSTSRKQEFLVVLRTGYKKDLSGWSVRNLTGSSFAGAEFRSGKHTVKVRFRREGDLGGEITTVVKGKAVKRELTRRVDDRYRHWSDDPRYQRWIKDPAFAFLHADP